MKKNISDRDFKLATIISTYFGIGFARICPGTAGSLMTFPLFFIINFLLLKSNVATLTELSICYALILIFISMLAFWAVDVYISKNNKDDPSEVVIDEVIGQLIAYMIPTILTLYYFMYPMIYLVQNPSFTTLIIILLLILPIGFFRLFDILKPGLVGYFDSKVKGATGIIMDDVIAGLYAGIVVSLINTLLIISVVLY